VSAYGRSKLAAENVLRQECRVEFTMLRPSAVYGPGDGDFLGLFRAARLGVSPRFGGGRQPLSLVYADDLAEVTVGSLDHPEAAGAVLNVAHPEVVTAGRLADEVARAMDRRPWRVSLPVWTLIPLSWGGEWVGRWTGKPGILGLDRRRELMAPGWVCSCRRLQQQLGMTCPTDLSEGLRRTLAWYRASGWI
jgi:nucleoside-diphosphate-sugar epimerase